RRREIQAGERGPRDHRRDVEIRDGERGPEEVVAAGERAVEDAERLAEARRRVVGLLRVALLLGEERAMQERGQERLLELGHRPDAPLVGTPLVLHALPPEALGVSPGE